MINPLAPQPMSPEQIADLVERTRANQTEAHERRATVSVARKAATWAHDRGETCAAAARKFGCDSSNVTAWWRRLYPGELTVGDTRRRRCA